MRNILLFLSIAVSLCGPGTQVALSQVPARDALSTFQTAPGVTLELIASEPQIVDPVAIAFDETGNLYVAENRDYPSGPGEGKSQRGSIAVLQDRDGDGFYEHRADFVEGLRYPGGLLPSRGGLFVTDAPDLLYFKDSDGDGKADHREIVLTGFAEGGSTQLRVSHPTYGLDGWIYLTNGLSGGTVSAPGHPGRPPVENPRSDWRFHPVTGEIQAVGGQAQYGLAFDYWGRRFVCSNRKPFEHVVLEPWHLGRNPQFAFTESVQTLLGGAETPARLFPLSDNITTADSHEGTFTAACGLAIYQGTALPDEYRGQGFICDPTGNLVHNMPIRPRGATFAVEPSDSTREFLASTDNWFRPVYLANGPGGALYLCDMYRKTIEHPNYLPDAIAAITDFESGKDRGRIYRIRRAAPDQPTAPRDLQPETLSPSDETGLVAALSSPEGWTRSTASRLLLEASGISVVPQLIERIALGDSPHDTEVFGAVNAFWLAAIRGDSKQALARAFACNHPRLVEQAFGWLDAHPEDLPGFEADLLAGAGCPDPRVRFLAALALAHCTREERLEAFADIVLADATDSWTRAALFTSAAGREAAWFAKVFEKSEGRTERLSEFYRQMGAILPIRLETGQLVSLLADFLSSNSESDLVWQVAGSAGLAEGLRRKGFGRSGEPVLSDFLAQPGVDPAVLPAQIDRLRGMALDTARSEDRSLALRVACLEFLGTCAREVDVLPLLDLVGPSVPDTVQAAALAGLVRLPYPEIGTALVTRSQWSVYTPAAQKSVLSGLLSNSLQLPALVQALEAGNIPLSALSAEYRTRLANHPDPVIADRAKALFGSLESSDRQKVYRDYKSVLELSPDARNGREVFRKNCAQCHRLDGEGFEVGPDLFSVRDQEPESLLLHVLDPNYELVAGYTNYLIETFEGDTLTGLIASESPTSLTLRWSGGEESTLLREDIVKMNSTQLSLMPDEIEKAMTRQDLRDLISYLKGEGVRKGERESGH